MKRLRRCVNEHRQQERCGERYRGTSRIRPMPGVLGGSQRDGRFLMGEVPLYLQV